MNSDIPIIALTADVTTVDRAKCTVVGMSDYLAKPVDEKLLYNKIASLLKKHALVKSDKTGRTIGVRNQQSRCIHLDNLIQRTKSNPIVVMEMIKAYLDQTPPLLIVMNNSYKNQDWSKLYSAVHKMIPSFAIMGISTDFENMAKEVQEYARAPQQSSRISDLLLQLSSVCTQACEELTVEYNRINKSGL